MFLTQVQESELMQKYNRLLWFCVHNFKRSSKLQDEEDLYQEAAIVFLNFIRSCDSMESLQTSFPFMDIKNALTRWIIAQQVVSFPKTRTTDFKRIMRSAKSAELKEEIAVKTSDDSSMDYIFAKLTLESYCHSLNETERKVLLLKSMGKRNREAAHELGVSEVKISRVCHRIKQNIQ